MSMQSNYFGLFWYCRFAAMAPMAIPKPELHATVDVFWPRERILAEDDLLIDNNVYLIASSAVLRWLCAFHKKQYKAPTQNA